MAMFGINLFELFIVGGVLSLMLAAVIVPVVLSLSSASKRAPAPNPNLLPCPDCGRLLSRQAITCPQCGRPMQSSPIR